ncbi:MAG: Nif11-like leader peptide family natural product precursor [Chlorobium limicola]|nr:Nif11-like leader peptide family natural product precursor [Chlorobium limicola]
MTIAQSKALYERLQADEVFRNRILAANEMEKRMEIIESYGFDCSNDEVQMVLNKYSVNTSPDICENYTLWGNRIPG